MFPASPKGPCCTVLLPASGNRFLLPSRSGIVPVPKFVEDGFRSFLECGILAHGFVRVRCRVSIGAPWKRRSMLAPIGLADERVLNNEQVKKYNGTKCCASHPPPLASDDVALC